VRFLDWFPARCACSLFWLSIISHRDFIVGLAESCHKPPLHRSSRNFHYDTPNYYTKHDNYLLVLRDRRNIEERHDITNYNPNNLCNHTQIDCIVNYYHSTTTTVDDRHTLASHMTLVMLNQSNHLSIAFSMLMHASYCLALRIHDRRSWSWNLGSYVFYYLLRGSFDFGLALLGINYCSNLVLHLFVFVRFS